jgi:uncharacterized membrane protein
VLHDHKLDEWRAQGLLDADTVARIRAYEEGHRRPVLLYVVGGLGALTVTLGVVAIIASNWEAIPGGVKLAIDLALAAALASGIVASHRRGIAWLRETLIALYFGYVLASIGLISQVYHLGGATWQALLAWSALCALLLTRAHSRGVATAWLLSLQMTYLVCLSAFAERTSDADMLALGLVPLGVLAPLAATASERLQRARPRMVAAFRGVAWTELAWMASFATFAFYEDPMRNESRGALVVGLGLSAALTGVLVLRARRLVARAAAAKPMVVLLGVVLFLLYVPVLLGLGGLNLVGALAFLGLWGTVAWLAHTNHDARLLNTATALLALRLLVIYFEVFGSLLSTGIGLISGGLLTLGLAWLWSRKRREFAAELAPAEGENAP